MIDKDKLEKHKQWVEDKYARSEGKATDLWAEAHQDKFYLQISEKRYSDPTRRKIEEEAWNRFIHDGARILDCGCGTGFFIGRIRDSLPDRTVRFHGLDLSEKALAIAKQRAPGVEFVCSPAEQMPYPDNHFDGVLLIAMLFESIDTGAIFREAARVLKSGGFVYMVIHKPFYDPFWLPSAAAFLYRKLRGLSSANNDLRRFRIRIESEFSQAGFQRIERRPFIYFYEWAVWKALAPFLTNTLFSLGEALNRLPFEYYKNQEYWILRKRSD